jgi:hypothetical protein
MDANLEPTPKSRYLKTKAKKHKALFSWTLQTTENKQLLLQDDKKKSSIFSNRNFRRELNFQIFTFSHFQITNR